MSIHGTFQKCALQCQILILLAYFFRAVAYHSDDSNVFKVGKRTMTSFENFCPDGWSCELEKQCKGLKRPWFFVTMWCDEASTRERLCCLMDNSTSTPTTQRNSTATPEFIPQNRKSLAVNGTRELRDDSKKISVPNSKTHDVASKNTRIVRKSENITKPSPSMKACEKYTVQKGEVARVAGNREMKLKELMEETVPLIFGGEKAETMEFPFIVAIGYESKSNVTNSSLLSWGCGGSILSERFVLTAAHCITEADEVGMRPSVVRAGVSQLPDDARRLRTDYGVASAVRHPLHRADQRHHDLALLRTDRRMTFSEAARPVCLPWAGAGPAALEAPGARLTAMGWGATNREGTKMSKDLKKVVLTVVSLEECRKFYSLNQISGENFEGKILCAADPERKSDTCLGDSGGPLIGKLNGTTAVLVGVTSFGSFPCVGESPGVYARTLPELPWIESVVWP